MTTKTFLDIVVAVNTILTFYFWIKYNKFKYGDYCGGNALEYIGIMSWFMWFCFVGSIIGGLF